MTLGGSTAYGEGMGGALKHAVRGGFITQCAYKRRSLANYVLRMVPLVYKSRVEETKHPRMRPPTHTCTHTILWITRRPPHVDEIGFFCIVCSKTCNASAGSAKEMKVVSIPSLPPVFRR